MSYSSERQEIVRVDSKGRVTIPAYMREELGMQEGSYTAVRMTRESRALSISLFAGAQSKLVEIKLMIPDRPGALARVARTLSELSVDLLASNSRTLKKGELAEWIVIADFAQSKLTAEDVKARVLKNKDAMSVEIKGMQD